MHSESSDRSEPSRVPTSAKMSVFSRAREERADSKDSELEPEMSLSEGAGRMGRSRLDHDKRRAAAGLPGIGVARSQTLAKAKLLSERALGRLQCSPLPVSIASRIREVVSVEVERGGYPLSRTAEDRPEFLGDSRLLDGFLRASSDPEVSVIRGRSLRLFRMFGCLVVQDFTLRVENGACESSKNIVTWRKIWQRLGSGTGTTHPYCLSHRRFVAPAPEEPGVGAECNGSKTTESKHFGRKSSVR